MSGFCHQRIGFWPSLSDAGFESIRADGIDDQVFDWHSGWRCAQPAQRIDEADPRRLDLLASRRGIARSTHQVVDDRKDGEFFEHALDRATTQHVHAQCDLEFAQTRFDLPRTLQVKRQLLSMGLSRQLGR